MSHAVLKLRPGADQNETPALNEAGISSSQLVRLRYDRTGLGLVEKLGGWTRFFPNTMTAIVRALWAWEDTQGATHLAFGTEDIGDTGSAQLGVISSGSLKDITPRSQENDTTVAAETSSGSSIVTITDAVVTNITAFDSVYIPVHIAIGGLILFGLYACNPDGHSATTTYTIQATDKLGNPLEAGSSSTSPSVALFATTDGQTNATVTLTAHGFAAGDTYPVLVPTTVGGVTFYGNYIVLSVVDADNFVISGGVTASATTTGSINGGEARYVYSFGIGSVPAGTGFGIGGFGTGGFGSGTAIVPSLGTAVSASDWTTDNWGEVLIACPLSGSLDSTPFQPIYQWDAEAGAPVASIIPQAPAVNEGVFLAMPQKQLVAYASTFTGIQDPLLLRWCDVDNYGVWLGTVTNQAGSFRIPKGSRIVGGLQTPQQGLIWTDIGLWSMQYIGQPYVYSFNEIGSGCGLIAKKAAAALNGTTYWMGPSQFFRLGAEGVEAIPCPIWDVIFQNLSQPNTAKIRIATNALFNEVWWFYPSANGTGEVDSYVKYNAVIASEFGDGAAWDFGTLGRSAWIDQSVLGEPIGADPSSLYLYQHETSPDADGQPMVSWFQTGWFAINEGDLQTFIDQVWPDMKFGSYGGAMNATVQLTIYAVDYPGQTPRTYGPYSLVQGTTFITPRIRARLISFRIGSSDIGSFWRLGAMRYRAAPDGKF